MRVIAGRLGGRKLRAAPRKGVRPTSDRVREALFARLGDLEGERVLDLYAGTGALGIEAISRGAHAVVFVERAADPLSVLRGNLRDLGLESYTEIFRAEARAAIRRIGREGRMFDLIFLDPPYADEGIEQVLGALVVEGIIAPDGMVVLETSKRRPLAKVEGLAMIDRREYGDTAITRWTREQGSATHGEGRDQ